jgi:apolipoprotein N-acyltransferase
LPLKRIHPLYLSLLSGLLLFLAWPVLPFTPLIFIAFVPLLLLEDQGVSGGAFFGWSYLSLFIWNASTTWWMVNSTVPGGIAAILANALLMTIPWMGYHSLKKSLGTLAGFLALPAFWLSFEYIHLNWELSWPWLTVGNVFATRPGWIQWYSITGTSGGTAWVFIINLFIFRILQKRKSGQKLPAQSFWILGGLIGLPVLVSYLMLFNVKRNLPGEAGSSNIVIVQPNIDPWDEKFIAGKQEAQLQKLIRLSESAIDEHTVLVVWPETAIPVAINEDSMKSSYFVQPVWDFLRKNPHISLLTGVEGFRIFPPGKKTLYSQPIPGSNESAEGYNSAILMDSAGFQAYHKSKLVPGVETLPSFLRFMDSWFEKFGGTTGGYARQEERTVLRTAGGHYAIAPAVCYESIYGGFMSQYVKRGANLLTVITNDGWWRNSPGYRQHENYARLRAVETRRWVARSANTGVSCFISPTGELLDAQPWDKVAVIKRTIPAETALSFFVAYGDIISWISLGMTCLLICWWLIQAVRKKWKLG